MKWQTKKILQEKKKSKKIIFNALKYTNIAFQMIVVIGAGTYGGVKLDEFFETNNQVFTIILSLFSVFAAIYIAIKDFINIHK
ncbi:MAG: AtpZ/AtpI family protein [Bacteroidales bacterium]|jgi:ATP synthase protein I|nr:AtpZ/AtpI family protein [Bacteroidales bacterium]